MAKKDNSMAEMVTKYNVHLYGFVYLSNLLKRLKSKAFPVPFAIYLFTIDVGYSIFVKKSPFAGTEVPAFFLSRLLMISCNRSSGILPRPISSKVPTMARTILRKNRFAVI